MYVYLIHYKAVILRMSDQKEYVSNAKFKNNPYRIGKSKPNRVVREIQGKQKVNMNEHRVVNVADKSTETIVRHFPHISNIFESRGDQVCYNADIALLIPKGRRCLFWFTVFEDQNVCFVIDCMYVNSHLTKNINRSSYFAIQTCFDTSLCYGNGTVLRGTHSRINNKFVGAIEDIYYYKGKSVQSTPLYNRLDVMTSMFTNELKQIRYFEKQCILAMCVTLIGSMKPEEIVKHAKSLPYPVKHIQFRYDKRKEQSIVNVDVDTYNEYIITQNSQHYKPTNIRSQQSRYNIGEKIFIVTADIQNDIYKLHTYNPSMGDNREFYSYAGIQSYDKSVMMNKLFRNIKENYNLDTLEESDDEEDFENIAIDKYVYLDKSYRMVCSYMKKINKWIPVKLADKKHRVATREELYNVGVCI